MGDLEIYIEDNNIVIEDHVSNTVRMVVDGKDALLMWAMDEAEKGSHSTWNFGTYTQDDLANDYVKQYFNENELETITIEE